MRQPDICMVVHNDLTHDSRVIREAKTLSRRGYRVRVVALTRRGYDLPSVETPFENFEIHRLTVPRWYRPLLHSGQSIFRVTATFLLAAIGALYLRRIRPRAFHAHDFPGLLQLALAGRLRYPTVYDAHELYFDRCGEGERCSPFYRRVMQRLRYLEKPLARRVSATITVAESIADVMTERLGIARPIAVRNCVDLRDQLGPQAALPETGGRLIVFTGNLIRGRYLTILVEAVPYMHDDISLVLLGAGEMEHTLRAIATESGVQHRVVFMPPVPPSAVSTTIAGAHAAMSLIEDRNLNQRLALPNKLFEAIAAGLPVICSSNHEMARLVQEYDIGAICEAVTPRSIADAVHAVLEQETHDRLKKQVIKAQQSLNWEAEERKLITIYEKVLAS